MQPPRALAQMQQRPCVAALRWHSRPSAPPRSCAPRACRRYPQRSQAACNPLASRASRGRTRPRGMLRAELAAYVGVIMLWRALDGAVRVAGVRGTTHETCNFCNVRRGETAEIISGPQTGHVYRKTDPALHACSHGEAWSGHLAPRCAICNLQLDGGSTRLKG